MKVKLTTRVVIGPAKYVQVLVDFLNGVYSGYPLCCVLNYMYLTWKEELPARVMGNDTTRYVRCEKCKNSDCKVERIRSGAIPWFWPDWNCFTKEVSWIEER